MVRTRLHVGVPPAQIPLAVSNETGVPVEAVQALVDERLQAARERERKRRRLWWIVAACGAAAGFALDRALGTSRGIGTALLLFALAVSTIALAWLVNQIRHL